MGRLDWSQLDADGERVANLFQGELNARGRSEEEWTIWQNHDDGVYIRLSVASKEDDPLLIHAIDLRVNKVPDYTILDSIRDYLRFISDRAYEHPSSHE
jgi:hypothetical protein